MLSENVLNNWDLNRFITYQILISDKTVSYIVLLQVIISLASMTQGVLEFMRYTEDVHTWIAWVYLIIWEPFGYFGIRVLDSYSQRRKEQMEFWFGIQFGWTIIVQIAGAFLLIFEPIIRSGSSLLTSLGILAALTVFWCALSVWMWTVAARWTELKDDGLVSPQEMQIQVELQGELGDAQSPDSPEEYHV